MKKKGQASKE